jgi:hypothetical protein
MKNKDTRVYFENGRIKRDNVIYLSKKAPPEFKEFYDVFLGEMKRLREMVEKNGKHETQS